MSHQQIWIALMAVVAGFAWLRGGWPERICAAAMVAAWLVSGLVQRRSAWVDPQWSVLVVDALLFSVLLWIALTSDRFWPLFASAFQLLGVVTHVAIVADRSIGGYAYFVAGVIWSYLVVIALAVGVWNVSRARAVSPSPA